MPPTISRVTPNRGLPVGGGRVIANFDCQGGPDLYLLDTSGNEHFYTNSTCLQGGSCGFFTDVTGLPGVLPTASKGSQCVGTDCLGNAKLLTFKYDAANPDIFIARSSGDGATATAR